MGFRCGCASTIIGAFLDENGRDGSISVTAAKGRSFHVREALRKSSHLKAIAGVGVASARRWDIPILGQGRAVA